jgi:protein-S-isoprenylcysteine O-methyltransferase Ste14
VEVEEPCYISKMVISLAYPSILYTVVLSVSYWLWIVIEIWLIARERRDASAVFQDRGSRTFLIVSLGIAVVFGIFTIPHVLPRFTIHSKAVVIGVALVWAGIAFRLWAIQTLGRFFNTRVVVRQEHRLITIGPYRYLRNPAYTGLIMIFLGFGVAIGNWISLITLLVFGCLPFIWRIAVEDRALAERFGHAYDEYRRKTWSLIPLIW